MAMYRFIAIVFVFQLIAETKTNGELIVQDDDVKSGDIRHKRSDDQGPLGAVVADLGQRVSELTAQLTATQTRLATTGSTFVRWGKAECPAGATTIYSGYAGSGYTGDTGAGANRICMTSHPVYDDTPMASHGHGTLYGAQYYFSGHDINGRSTDVVCSLCHTSYSATFMVPGTNRCPNGTTKQYQGHLSVGDLGHPAASEFLCVDSNPDDRPGSTANEACAWFDHAVTVCGSLPCPPYVSGKVVTCVVCSQ